MEGLWINKCAVRRPAGKGKEAQEGEILVIPGI